MIIISLDCCMHGCVIVTMLVMPLGGLAQRSSDSCLKSRNNAL